MTCAHCGGDGWLAGTLPENADKVKPCRHCNPALHARWKNGELNRRTTTPTRQQPDPDTPDPKPLLAALRQQLADRKDHPAA